MVIKAPRWQCQRGALLLFGFSIRTLCRKNKALCRKFGIIIGKLRIRSIYPN